MEIGLRERLRNESEKQEDLKKTFCNVLVHYALRLGHFSLVEI